MRNPCRGREPISTIELSPGRLYRLGGTIPVDGRTTWFAPHARGHAPVSCYLVLEGASALLIDTGLPIHESLILRQLEECLPKDAELSVLVTRPVEFESLGNVDAIVKRFPVKAFYARIPGYAQQPAISSLQPMLERIDWRAINAADLIDVDVHRPGRRTLDVIPPLLRLLMTSWVYDKETRTLFTSDAFTHALLSDPDGSAVLTESDDDVTAQAVHEHLDTKFDWLASADTRPILASLKTLLDEYDIETVAPTHGRILQGRRVVVRHFELIVNELATLATARYANVDEPER